MLRGALLISSLLLACAIWFAHAQYLGVVWQYYGFTYADPGIGGVIFALGLVSLGAITMPPTLRNPSSIVLLALYVVVYVPTVVISVGLLEDSISRYGVALISLSISFCGSCLAVRFFSKSIDAANRLPSVQFERAVFAIWLVLLAILVITYLPIMSFAGLDDVYSQRAAAAGGGWLAYIKSYFSNVFSPALIAIGLCSSKRRFLIAGFVGCVVFYMITAQRTYFLLPVIALLLNAAIASKKNYLSASAIPVAFVAIVVFLSIVLYEESVLASLSSVYFVFRALGLPALSFSQYHDFFGFSGYTWWSHIKGIDLLISQPAYFAQNSLWPGLGYIVGDNYYNNPDVNSNANLFAADGLAAAGSLGVMVIGICFSVWLVILDRVARRWNKSFALLTILPVGLALTNGQFFTTLLSFGGLFWLFVFRYGIKLPKIRWK